MQTKCIEKRQSKIKVKDCRQSTKFNHFLSDIFILLLKTDTHSLSKNVVNKYTKKK